MADVPVALLLSGGLDSSAIAASLRKSDTPVVAYTARFKSDLAIDEWNHAKRIASHLALQHQEIVIDSADLWAVIAQLAHAHDEPFADAANIPLFLLAQAVNHHAKVVIQGDGGDELFGGYRRYSVLRHRQLLSLIPHAACSLLLRGGEVGRRIARIATSVKSSRPSTSMAGLLTMESVDAPPESIFASDRSRELCSGTDPFLAYIRAADRFSTYDRLQQQLLTDLTVQLPYQFLPKVDRATMASGVEARVPLLDEHVVRLAVGMPVHWKVRGLERKAILRAALRGRLPAPALRARKRGLSVPVHRWLRGPLRQGVRERLLDSGFIDRFGLESRTLQRWLEGDPSTSAVLSVRIWRMLQLALWHRRPPLVDPCG